MVQMERLADVIPTPKELRPVDGAPLRSRNHSPVFRVIGADNVPQWAAAVAVIREELADMSKGRVEDDPDAAVDFRVKLRVGQGVAGGSPEGYRLAISEVIDISANEPAGWLYAIATLRQLLIRAPAGEISFSRCVIDDYPDVELRCAARWLVELEGTRMMYDWGDGREKMLERYRRKIDFCMRHKINMAFFDGFEWKTDKYPQYLQDVRALNAYAAARNVRLEFGGHGIGFGGFPGHTLEGIKGLGGYNRRSYPDGAIYECGRAAMEFNPHRPSITSAAMRNGTCRSNDALNQLKRQELADYVRQVEPRALFIHNEDISALGEFEQMWLNRCPACRARWPEDRIDSPRGAAGAIAHGLECLYEGIASVKNHATGYDGGRDCQVIFASPAYGIYGDDDATWGRISDFWTAISRQLGHAGQIMFCVREQFLGIADNRPRIRRLADRMKQEGGGHGLFVFVVSGADLYSNSALFTAAPRLNHFFEGARSIFNFNGGLFAAPQEIYNAEYAWNLRSRYGIDEAANQEEAGKLYRRRALELEYLDPDPLMKRACALCYGEASDEMMNFYTCRDTEGNYPATMLFRILRMLLKKTYAEQDHLARRRQWRGIHAQTILAMDIIKRALLHPLPREEVRQELLHLQGCLAFGEKLSEIVADIFEERPQWQQIESRIAGLRQFIAHYPKEFTSRFEGESNLWEGYLDRLSKFIEPRGA